MNNPSDILKKGIEKYNARKIEILYSGGKDSSSTIHATINALKELNINIPVRLHYWNTGINAKENTEFVIDISNKLGLELVQTSPEKHFNYESLTERFGFLSVGGHRYALGFLKWFGFRKYARENKHENIMYVSGRRLYESKSRTSMVSNKPLDKVESNMNFCAPIYYWDNDYTRKYILNNNIKVSPVYNTIGTDGNCQCGCYASSDELKVTSIFHKDLFEKILHIDERLGGIREVKFVLDIEKCPYCESKSIFKSKNRFIDGKHYYIYTCLRGHTIKIEDNNMPFELGLKDMGHWGNGVNPPANELINVPNIACHGCLQFYLEKHTIKDIKNNKSRPIIPQKYYDKIFKVN